MPAQSPSIGEPVFLECARVSPDIACDGAVIAVEGDIENGKWL
jgi:hypothetical protein